MANLGLIPPCLLEDLQGMRPARLVAMPVAFVSAFTMHAGLLCAAANTAADSSVDFNRDVRPILAENCFKCHGPDGGARQAALRLDTREGATARRSEIGAAAAIVPMDPGASELIRRVSSEDADERMPPAETGKQLTPGEIDILRRWIAVGATYARHWSLEPIRPQPLPDVSVQSWVRNPIDRFVLARLEARSVSPAPDADRITLIRRLYLDLLGLAPSIDAVDRFVRDRRPDAYDALVRALLANPHFGERWGRHWLDQARYADSHGYTNDGARSMWPYRDWVIRAFNDDVPFDRFTIEQLAGDLLPEPTTDQLIATGFHRNTLINSEGGAKPDQFRVEQAKDRLDTTGVVWLGLTVGCAKCHTHKYDPIEQTEYYRLYAFFDSTKDRNSVSPTIRLPTPSQRARLAELDARIAAAQPKSEAKGSRDGKGSQDVKEAEDPELKKLKTEREKLQKAVVTSMIFRELDKPRETYVHIRGDFLRPGERVEPGVPAALPALGTAGGRPTRLDLSHWLLRPDNPLTARVRVNRIWMRLFGRGLVETENDFGTQGSLPSHPGLLDWLAGAFMRQGWSTKRLIETIVTSSTYRQASEARPDLEAMGPRNLLLARQNRLRVEAEIVRDLALSASGLLSEKLGGPSVYPPQPDGVYAFTQSKKNWKTSPGADRYRRGLYTFFYRTAPHPMLSTFDVPKFTETCTRRDRSNTPLQSLTVANDAAMFEMAQALARRVLTERQGAGGIGGYVDDAVRLQYLFRLCLARPPHEDETQSLLGYLERQHERFLARQEDADRVRPDGLPDAITSAEAAAWTGTARVVLNLDEFITRE